MVGDMRNRWISLTLGGVAAIVAVGAGAAAVNAATTDDGHNVLSQRDVANRLAAEHASVGANATPSRAAPATDGSQVANTVSGTVVVRCSGNVATLLRWSPKAGFRADDPVFGPASVVSIRFESDVAEDVRVSVSCANGVAAATTAADDRHGGNRGPGAGSPTANPSPTATDDHGGGSGRAGHDDAPGDTSGSGGHGADDGPTHS